jgi:cellulose synthase (UDP-forming)
LGAANPGCLEPGSRLEFPVSNSGRIHARSESSAQSARNAVGLQTFLAPVFTGWRRAANGIGIAAWLAALAFFWVWWLDPAHVGSVPRYILITAVMLWVTLVPGYFILVFARAAVPFRGLDIPQTDRVAMIVTKAPSEPWDMVRATLEGALAQQGVLHDTWLADEDPAPEVVDWCREHDVQISCRRDAQDYHRDHWPRRKACKEGNLAYFYDQYGYDRYDIVCQFDADHVPSKDYLLNAIGPFADPRVGYVSAPSICDLNAAASWSARGRLYVEASLHGALQSGYNAGWAPLCIGSHYTVRTAALKQVGGLGPELAEDHSTSLLMNAGGWKGVHAIGAVAHGEGPETFSDLVTQEFQWSRSLVTILLQYTPRYLAGLRGRIRFQFLFSELWYPMFSGAMAIMFALPIVGLLTGENFVNVTYIEFFVHMLPLSLSLLVLAYWWRSTGTFRPADAPIISWEGIAFMFLRWPWSLIGSLVALWDRVTGRYVNFRITPKGYPHKEPLPFRVIAPYVFLSGVSGAAALAVEDAGTAAGFYIYALLNAVLYGVGILLILGMHALENETLPLSGDLGGFTTLASIVMILGLVIAASYFNGPMGLRAVNAGITAFTLTETVYLPAGAGQGKPGQQIVRFRPRWHGFSSSVPKPIEETGK